MLAGVVFLICALCVVYIAVSAYCNVQTKIAYNGALGGWQSAMEDGDGARAIEQAEKALALRNRDGDETRLAQAFELNGDYEKASELYRRDGSLGVLTEARLAYKTGDKTKAFERYCEYAQEIAEREYEINEFRARSEAPRYGSLYEAQKHTQIKELGRARIAITSENDPRTTRLAPFWKYAEFLALMEEEFAAAQESPERAVAMEFFRKIASDETNPEAGWDSVEKWVATYDREDARRLRERLEAERAAAARPAETEI